MDRAAARATWQHFAGLAEWDAAFHAASALFAVFGFALEVQVEFTPVFDTFQRGAVGWQLALVFHETSRFTHDCYPYSLVATDTRGIAIVCGESCHQGFFARQTLLFKRLDRFQHPLVVIRHDAHEISRVLIPVA